MLFFTRILLVFIACLPSFANSVLITGANQGIGMGFVKHYLQKDYRVYATFRSKEKSEELLALRQDTLITIQVDFEQPAEAAETIKKHY